MGTIVPRMGAELGRASGPIAAALFGSVRQAVLRTLFSHPDRRFYQRQLIRTLGLGSGAVQRELINLTAAGILERTVDGNQTYYQANPLCPVYNELREMVRKTFGLTGVLGTALQPLAGSIRVAFVCDSLAAGREKAGSDVDVLVVGDKVSLDDVVSALDGASQDLGREVNPSVYVTEEFCRKLAEGRLSSVLSRPKIFLIGSNSELARLAQVRMAQGTPNQPPGNQRSLQAPGTSRRTAPK